jgi:extradiol dioxygenase family protein
LHGSPILFLTTFRARQPQERFKGQPGEQWTMFLKDPSNNALEFKAMANPEFLFARYSVDGH